jgi:hypothetical protein
MLNFPNLPSPKQKMDTGDQDKAASMSGDSGFFSGLNSSSTSTTIRLPFDTLQSELTSIYLQDQDTRLSVIGNGFTGAVV